MTVERDPDQRLRLNEAEIARVLIRAAAVPYEQELLTQVDNAIVLNHSGTWIDLAVDTAGSSVSHLDGPLPIRGAVVDDSGQPIGLILLWMTGGFLSAIEHAWVTDDVPTKLPEPDRVTPVEPVPRQVTLRDAD